VTEDSRVLLLGWGYMSSQMLSNRTHLHTTTWTVSKTLFRISVLSAYPILETAAWQR
jgi:sucrose-6-phosphate hydrolase SacC (GH32 family)